MVGFFTRARCQDCNEITDVKDPDELAVCTECTRIRRRAEEGREAGDGQAGARFIGQQREAAMRPTFAERMAQRRKKP